MVILIGAVQGMITENKLGQKFEVLTPPQGYLMDKTFVHYNNRGLTDSPLVSLSNPIHFFSIKSVLLNIYSVSRPTVIFQKILPMIVVTLSKTDPVKLIVIGSEWSTYHISPSGKSRQPIRNFHICNKYTHMYVTCMYIAGSL